MRRKRWLALGAVALLLLVAGAWAVLRRAEPPDRLPDLFGTLEQASAPGDKPGGFLIRCHQPPPGVPESSQNVFERTYGPRMWVVFREGTVVRRRAGGPGRVAVGQTVSAWFSGPMSEKEPPIVHADFVIIESDGP